MLLLLVLGLKLFFESRRCLFSAHFYFRKQKSQSVALKVTDQRQSMSNNAIPKDFLKNILHNGVGRYVCQLQRITFRFCKSHGGSRHMRDFIENHLLDFTQKNPGVVVYLQPRRHRPPSIMAEFLNGRREVMEMSGKEVGEICKWTEYMRTRSGVQIVNMIQNNHTDTPSTQGIWHPFMFRDTQEASITFPNSELSKVLKTGKTATDFVLEEFSEAASKNEHVLSGTEITDK